MRLTPDQLTYGIEEEYFLVDPATGALIDEAPEAFLRASRARLQRRLDQREKDLVQAREEQERKTAVAVAS